MVRTACGSGRVDVSATNPPATAGGSDLAANYYAHFDLNRYNFYVQNKEGLKVVKLSALLYFLPTCLLDVVNFIFDFQRVVQCKFLFRL